MADPCTWREVFVNNADGTRSRGELNLLVAAIESGG